jgi:antitoxin (DNA-binding transcriptional repressor) of toxin-antitoxin stability system
MRSFRLNIDFVTIRDYHRSMISVRVADLKSRLSEHLRKVRGGRIITVLDRTTPIARIVPYEEHRLLLTVRSPVPGSPTLRDIPMPPPLRLHRDSLAVLLEERQGER